MNLLASIWNKISSDIDSDVRLENLEACVSKINDLKSTFQNLTDAQLKHKAQQLSASLDPLEPNLDPITIETFAITREASKRVLGMFHYDTQLLAGLILSKCALAEIATGEGKTLIATLPSVLHGFKHKGVHIVTTNAYLAQRDYETTSPLYNFLGLSTDCVDQDDSPQEKFIKYKKDILFGTGYQFGFDYLREQLRLLAKPKKAPGYTFKSTLLGQIKSNKESFFSHKFADFVIIDEVDSVLLDEAHMPLVISAASKNEHPNPQFFKAAKKIAATLTDADFKINEQQTAITLTNAAQEKIYSASQALNLKGLKRPFHLYVLNALKAQKLFHNDIHYVIEEGELAIVDQNTGRKFKERTWRDGLHQAVQAKENILITEESQSLASITRQRYFNFYKNISGMSGTVAENKEEFKECYEINFQKVPLFKPSQQIYYPTRVFNSWDNVLAAVINNIETEHKKGRPVLIGTRSIFASEQVADKLSAHGLKFKLLNAKQDAQEAEIIKVAGQHSAITIATNMAGRGTHIDVPEDVQKLGGLHVLALEKNESPRIDRQLTGRTARQGQPGSAQFFLSADDYIINRYTPELTKKLLEQKFNDSGECDSKHSAFFDDVQKKIQKEHYYHRQHLIKHDDWIESIKNKL